MIRKHVQLWGAQEWNCFSASQVTSVPDWVWACSPRPPYEMDGPMVAKWIGGWQLLKVVKSAGLFTRYMEVLNLF